MAEPVDALDLGDGARLAIVPTADGLSAVPMVRDGGWRRAHPGDGVAEALLGVLADVDESKTFGAFTIRGWSSRAARGERAVGVDQTNESVIVGNAAVVKWATHLQPGPHPAPHRLAVLRAAGFVGMPQPWGLITWAPDGAAETLAASVDEYLPGAVDGWTWAVDLVTRAASGPDVTPLTAAAGDVGVLVAEMHDALASTTTVASAADAARWRDEALAVLDAACAVHDGAAAHRGEIAALLAVFGTLAGTAVLDGHGDLHVGQVLRSGGRFVVTDFDGNPVLPAGERALPIPAALDVAGMAQSLTHGAIVARRYTDLDAARVAEVDAAARTAFLTAYQSRLRGLGRDPHLEPMTLRAFRLQQVLREIVYAARHLPRWMYVPDAALPALLEEGRTP